MCLTCILVYGKKKLQKKANERSTTGGIVEEEAGTHTIVQWNIGEKVNFFLGNSWHPAKIIDRRCNDFFDTMDLQFRVELIDPPKMLVPRLLKQLPDRWISLFHKSIRPLNHNDVYSLIVQNPVPVPVSLPVPVHKATPWSKWSNYQQNKEIIYTPFRLKVEKERRERLEYAIKNYNRLNH